MLRGFFGLDSRQIVENLLIKHKEGAYLVRVSQTEWLFILSSMRIEGISHKKIFRIGDLKFKCLEHEGNLIELVSILVESLGLSSPPPKTTERVAKYDYT